jgi:hypothetical protein
MCPTVVSRLLPLMLLAGGGWPAAAKPSAVHRGRVQLGGRSYFLPWGVYMADVTNADLDIIHDAGFNSVLA